MVLLRCNVRVSWYAQLLSMLTYGSLSLLILLAPWPGYLWPLWLFLLTGVIFECIRSQRRIAHRNGELSFSSSGVLYWQKQSYKIVSRPLILKQAVFLRLYGVHSGKSQRLWLAVDSLPQEEWRLLRQLLLRWTPMTVKG